MNLDNTLKSIYLRLDVNMQNLVGKAIAQIIIKIIYSNNDGMSAKEIKEALAKVNKNRHIDSEEVDKILKSLVPQEIQLRKGNYYLSSPKRQSIDNAVKASKERKENILYKYFNRLNSSHDVISDWLTDVTIKFFEVFSDEWISDLLARTKNVLRSEDAIRDLITKRTNANKKIDKDDKHILPSKFFEFVNSHDSIVEEYLWEYGTSAFASILITNRHGVDQLTLDTFRDSCCILDTNILLYIALESKFTESLGALEKVFRELNIKVKILYITQKEYEGKVRSQRMMTISNLEKLGYDVTTMPNDDFTNYAKRLHCQTRSDFESFFDYTLAIPKYIHESLPIQLLDNDKKLAEVIQQAQDDEQKCNKLNSIFKSVVKHDKGRWSTRHDIGLLEGVDYLRKNEDSNSKYFILSEEVSVIQYAKECGFKNGLPLSIRVSTLINMLAVNNGGETFEASNYKSLFANLIRYGLVPQKDTFRQSELYELFKMNSRIANLPSQNVKDIAIQIHNKLISGEKDDDLRRDLNELVTKGEINVGDELTSTKNELLETNKEKERIEKERKTSYKALENSIREQVIQEYDKETQDAYKKFHKTVPLASIFLIFTVMILFELGSQSNTWIEGVIISIISSIIVDVFSNIYAQKHIIQIRKRERNNIIEKTTRERVQAQLARAQYL